MRKIANQLTLFDEPGVSDNASSRPFYLLFSDDGIVNKVRHIKNQLGQWTGKRYKYIDSPAHISFYEFDSTDENAAVVERISRKLLDQLSFEITLDGVAQMDCGKNKKTLYVKIEDPAPIYRFQKVLIEEFGGKESKDLLHMTIATKIPVEDLAQLPDMPGSNFNTTMRCRKIVILTKRQDHDGGYERVGTVILNDA